MPSVALVPVVVWRPNGADGVRCGHVTSSHGRNTSQEPTTPAIGRSLCAIGMGQSGFKDNDLKTPMAGLGGERAQGPFLDTLQLDGMKELEQHDGSLNSR